MKMVKKTKNLTVKTSTVKFQSFKNGLAVLSLGPGF
jgi:hypothetical protein